MLEKNLFYCFVKPQRRFFGSRLLVRWEKASKKKFHVRTIMMMQLWLGNRVIIASLMLALSALKYTLKYHKNKKWSDMKQVATEAEKKNKPKTSFQVISFCLSFHIHNKNKTSDSLLKFVSCLLAVVILWLISLPTRALNYNYFSLSFL